MILFQYRQFTTYLDFHIDFHKYFLVAFPTAIFKYLHQGYQSREMKNLENLGNDFTFLKKKNSEPL